MPLQQHQGHKASPREESPRQGDTVLEAPVFAVVYQADWMQICVSTLEPDAVSGPCKQLNSGYSLSDGQEGSTGNGHTDHPESGRDCSGS